MPTSLSDSAQRLLLLAQTCLDAGSSPATAQPLADRIFDLMTTDDGDRVLPEILACSEPSARLIATLAWQYAHHLALSDGTYEQYVYALPVVAAMNQRPFGRVAFNHESMDLLLSPLYRSKLVSADARLWALPYFYSLEEIGSMTPVDLKRINLLAFQSSPSGTSASAVHLSLDDPVWRAPQQAKSFIDEFNTQTNLHLFFVLIGIADRPENMINLLEQPSDPERAKEQQALFNVWAQGTQGALCQLLKTPDTFITSMQQFPVAIQEGQLLQRMADFNQRLHAQRLPMSRNTSLSCWLRADALPSPTRLMLDVYQEPEHRWFFRHTLIAPFEPWASMSSSHWIRDFVLLLESNRMTVHAEPGLRSLTHLKHESADLAKDLADARVAEALDRSSVPYLFPPPSALQ